jgi:hypothetical protein
MNRQKSEQSASRVPLAKCQDKSCLYCVACFFADASHRNEDLMIDWLQPSLLARPIQRVDGADGFRAADAAGRSDFLIAVLART